MNKKFASFALATITIGGLGMFLAGCSSKENTEASATSSSQLASSSSKASSASSQTSASSSSQAAEEKMSVTDLANGDFSSVKGKWQNDKGEQLVFDDTGLVSDVYEFGGASVTDYGTASSGIYGGETGGFLLEFIPSGVKIADTENFKDNSDSSQDRLWTGVGIKSFDEQGSFYYRVK